MVAAATPMFLTRWPPNTNAVPARPADPCSGMFTANSMNCLMEAIGLALPGNGTMLATHADRKALFLQAARRIMQITGILRTGERPNSARSVASFEAFENAMTLDIAMGVQYHLHLLAAAQEAEVDFSLVDIDRLSRKVGQFCKVAPNTQKYHIEDVHRAGGIMGHIGRT